MVQLSIIELFESSKVNPYKTLGITPNSTKSEVKRKFKEKMMEVRDDNKLRAELCMADDIILNRQFYKECEKDIFEFDPYLNNGNILCHYYTVIGDALKLYGLILNERENKDLIFFKDPSQRNLLYIAARNGHVDLCELIINLGLFDINDIQYTGSTPLHAAAYYGHIKVVQLLLNYGARTDIKNNFGNLPIDEAMTKEIKNLLKENEKDRIDILYKSLASKNIAKNIFPLYSHGEIVAKKIVCKLNNLPEYYNIYEVAEDWITAWHGTRFQYLESIAEVGLKPAGGKLKDGKEIKICVGHIDRTITLDNIPNWGEAIFVSPSIFYCAHPAYAKEIVSSNESWKIFVEVRVKPKSYIEHGSTVRNYQYKEGEPKALEYRIEPENEKDVQVVSLTFIKSNFLETINRFEESIFLNFKFNKGDN